MGARSRLAALAIIVAALAGCGQTTHQGTRPSATVRSCLKSHGLRVIGGPVGAAARGDSGAIGELISRGTFIAFYPSARIADQHVAALRANAARLHGSVARRGAVSVLFVGVDLRPGLRQTILNCS